MVNSNGVINTIGEGFSHLSKYYGNIGREAMAAYKSGNYKIPFLKDKQMREDAVKHAQDGADLKGVDLGEMSYKRMAGVGLAAFAAVNVPYRMLSGGSLYRDSNGNSNLIGVPLL